MTYLLVPLEKPRRDLVGAPGTPELLGHLLCAGSGCVLAREMEIAPLRSAMPQDLQEIGDRSRELRSALRVREQVDWLDPDAVRHGERRRVMRQPTAPFARPPVDRKSTRLNSS